jgi:sulfhydrogenase subunit beta (sulfur reductase)
MSGNGMTGAHGSRISDLVVSKKNFFSWLDALGEKYSLIGPVRIDGQTEFRKITSSGQLNMEYGSTMLSPGKVYLYKPREELFRFAMDGDPDIRETPGDSEQRVIVGLHSCDTMAVFYLDKTFLGGFRDSFYEARRRNTVIISLNCGNAGRNCFCSSMGTGPFLKAANGYDMQITDFGPDYLVEMKTDRARNLFNVDDVRQAGEEEFRAKAEKEKKVLQTFTKSIDINGLDKLLKKNPEHLVWRATAEESCLSCTNCVMVCPTCFCYDMFDEISMDGKSVRRFRQWDACQDAYFAAVHGGNFRGRRTARLRQFVTHKLDQTHQYGMFGTVGCGRCITWCPTGIDLTEMAKEVQRGEPA